MLSLLEYPFIYKLKSSYPIISFLNKSENKKLFSCPFKYNFSAALNLEELQLFETHFDQKNMFCLNKLYLSNGGKYDSPATTLAVFIADCKFMNEDDVALLNLLDNVNKKEHVENIRI